MESENDENFFKSFNDNVKKIKEDNNIDDINEIIINISKKKIHIEELLKNRKGYEKEREEIKMIMKERCRGK